MLLSRVGYCVGEVWFWICAFSVCRLLFDDALLGIPAAIPTVLPFASFFSEKIAQRSAAKAKAKAKVAPFQQPSASSYVSSSSIYPMVALQVSVSGSGARLRNRSALSCRIACKRSLACLGQRLYGTTYRAAGREKHNGTSNSTTSPTVAHQPYAIRNSHRVAVLKPTQCGQNSQLVTGNFRRSPIGNPRVRHAEGRKALWGFLSCRGLHTVDQVKDQDVRSKELRSLNDLLRITTSRKRLSATHLSSVLRLHPKPYVNFPNVGILQPSPTCSSSALLDDGTLVTFWLHQPLPSQLEPTMHLIASFWRTYKEKNAWIATQTEQTTLRFALVVT